jgi:hypothetical protein
MLKKVLRQWRTRERPDAVLTIHREWHERLAKAGIVSAYLNDVSSEPGAPITDYTAPTAYRSYHARARRAEANGLANRPAGSPR